MLAAAVITYLSSSKIVQCDEFRKPCSGYKLKEINGSGIFVANGENGASESDAGNRNNRTSVRVYQVLLYSEFSRCMHKHQKFIMMPMQFLAFGD